MFSSCSQTKGQRDPNGPWLISVVRSRAWGLGEEEDVWPVEVGATATVSDLRVKIEELYEVPQDSQLLARTDNASTRLEGSVLVAELERQRVYLLPAPEASADAQEYLADEQAQLAGMEAFLGAAQEAMEMNAALEESMRGVTYNVHFYRPEDSGGAAAGKSVALSLDALSVIEDVQQIVELELFGAAGTEPAHLALEGRPLPPHVTLFQAGIDDGKVVQVLRNLPPQVDEQNILQGLIGNGAGGFAVPADM